MRGSIVKLSAIWLIAITCICQPGQLLHGAESAGQFITAPPLTNAQTILDLGWEAARHSALSARIQGLVTYPDPASSMIYVQDASAGLRVIYTNGDYSPVAGQLVIVEGSIAAGNFAPYLDCSNIRVLGIPGIPEPCEAPAARLAAGELFGQWVQVEGVIRDVARDAGRGYLSVSSGGMRFYAIIQPFAGSDLPVDWLDARIILRGVCWPEMDSDNKPISFTLYVPGTNQVFFAHPGVKDIFLQSSLPLSLRPELRRQSDTRLKVEGVVSFHSPGGQVYLQSDGGAIRARLLVPLAHKFPQARHINRPPVTRLRPGQRIELVGAPVSTNFAPLLQDAEFRTIGETAPPVPTPVSVEDALSGRFEAQLISVKAQLLTWETRQAGPIKQQVLALRSGDTIFEALWEFTGTNTQPSLPKNSYIEATGICDPQPGELGLTRSFQLLIREPADLRLLGRPPWWESVPVGKILGVTIVLGTAAVGWIWMLRRQVSQRTAQLQAEVAERKRAQADLRFALAAERELSQLRSRFVSMVSHEFRTPLGVIMSAAENLDAYFDRLKPEQRRSQLNSVSQAASQMAKVMENVLLLSRAEAGRMEFKPAAMDLDEFCHKLANEVEASFGCSNRISIKAPHLPTAQVDENLLRHILTNLLSNALKYSQGKVEVTIEAIGEDAVLRVGDHGIGIPRDDLSQLYNAFHRGSNASHLAGTGLGLVIVKRCLELHGGQISCDSTEGKGTTFTVRLPLFNAAQVA